MSIFRKEALEYQCMRLSGTVSLRPERHLGVIGLSYVVCAIVVCAAFFRMAINTNTPVQCVVNPSGHGVTLTGIPASAPGVNWRHVDINVDGRTYRHMLEQHSKADFTMNLNNSIAPGMQCNATAFQELQPATIIAARIF